jgi:uncharacterized protein (TIGR02453 family)
MNFTGFPKESITFLNSIRQNNTKEWFEAHRDEYEQLIKEPSAAYVVEMGEHLQALVPTIKAKPKVNGSLFRIYRDVRFSKDKTPIKSRIGVIFWQGVGKRMQSSSFYMHFSPDEIFFAAGIRGFSKETLSAYRDYIKDDNHADALVKILDTLKAMGYHLPEPKYKRVPREFDAEMVHSELTKFASMFAYKEIAPNEILFSENLVDYAYEIYEDLLSLQQWVYEMTLTVDAG